MCKRLRTLSAAELFLTRVYRHVIDEIRSGLESCFAQTADVRAFLRVHKLVPLQQLLVLKALVALVADETTTVVVFCFPENCRTEVRNNELVYS